MGTSTIASIAALFSLQWGLQNNGEPQRILIDHYTSGFVQGVASEDVRLPPAVNTTKKIIVAVLDTGVDAKHSQLKNRLAGKGFNFVANNDDTSDTHGHGTHISGIIAAESKAKDDFRGLTQNALILPVKVVQTGPNAPIRPQQAGGQGANPGTALTENVAKGIEYAVQQGAQVINLSLAWPSSIRSKAVDHAVEMARAKNVLIVSSAGNDGTTANVYPCIYENVICVGAHGPDGALTYFSNHGGMVDILAPGITILSTWPLEKSPNTFAGQVGYEFRNGTSMAAPFVVAALAELLARGYSPDEATNRLLLGSRSVAERSLFTSSLVGRFTKNTNPEEKTSRFGNLDLTSALALSPSPLILPKRKAPYQIYWDGISPQINLPLEWVNRWKDAGEVKIRIETLSAENKVAGNAQEFNFLSFKTNALFTTSYALSLNTEFQNSVLHLRAHVSAEGFEKDSFDIPVQVIRAIDPTKNFKDLPKKSEVKVIAGFVSSPDTSVRSVVSTDQNLRPDLVFMQPTASGLKLSLVQEDQLGGSTLVTSTNLSGTLLTEDQLINIYRLPDQSYAAIFILKDKNGVKNKFLIQYYDRTFNLLRETILGTETTILNENLKWMKLGSSYVPMWLSVGFTPKLDEPKYNPWNPNYKDLKMPRVYTLLDNDLRILKFEKDDFPLKVLENGKVLVSNGEGYFQSYFFVHIEDGKVIDRKPVPLEQYRMLIGTNPSIGLHHLNGSKTDELVVFTPSSPGTLRATGTGSHPFSFQLNRASPLESLMQIFGGFTENDRYFFFAQTHYDLKIFEFATSAGALDDLSDETASISLNRYSYLPSMASNRAFFPVVVKDKEGKGHPGMYSYASLANSYTSEVVVALRNSAGRMTLVKPAHLRLKLIESSCTGLENLIPATDKEPAKQVFVCGSTLIRVPLTLD